MRLPERSEGQLRGKHCGVRGDDVVLPVVGLMACPLSCKMKRRKEGVEENGGGRFLRLESEIMVDLKFYEKGECCCGSVGLFVKIGRSERQFQRLSQILEFPTARRCFGAEEVLVVELLLVVVLEEVLSLCAQLFSCTPVHKLERNRSKVHLHRMQLLNHQLEM